MRILDRLVHRSPRLDRWLRRRGLLLVAVLVGTFGLSACCPWGSYSQTNYLTGSCMCVRPDGTWAGIC